MTAVTKFYRPGNVLEFGNTPGEIIYEGDESSGSLWFWVTPYKRFEVAISDLSYFLDERNHTRTFNTVSTNTTLDNTYRIVKVDCTSGDITITLPTAVGFTGMFDIVKIDSTSNSVIVVPNGVQTISGETTQEIFGQYDNMNIYSDGSNWLIH